jgi:hypothetical protein
MKFERAGLTFVCVPINCVFDFPVRRKRANMAMWPGAKHPVASVPVAAAAAAGGKMGPLTLRGPSRSKPDDPGAEKPVGDDDPVAEPVLYKRPVHQLHYRPLRASLHQDYVKRKTANHNVFRGTECVCMCVWVK